MADKTAQTIYIDAEPATVMDVIADIGSYPDWVAEYKETEVLESDDEGYPQKARLVLDAAVLKDTMVLAYTWPADRTSVPEPLGDNRYAPSSALSRELDTSDQVTDMWSAGQV